MRRTFAIISMVSIVAVCSFFGGQVSAQTVPAGFQDYTFVRDSSGETWLILRASPGVMVRVGIPIFPATDAEIASVPVNGQWLVPGDGARMSVERPAWALRGTISQVTSGIGSVFQPPASSPVAAAVPPTVVPTATLTPLPTFTPLPTSTPLPTATPWPTSTPIPSEGIIKREGTGDRDSNTFRLNGGNYTVRWDLDVPRNSGRTSCSFVGKLKNRDTGGVFYTFASDSFVTSGRNGELRLTSVPSASRYVFDVDGDCEWEIWIQP